MRFLNGFGEYSGEEANRQRPRLLTGDAASAIFLMMLDLVIIALLVGRNVGPFMLLALLFMAVDVYDSKIRKPFQGNELKLFAVIFLCMAFLFTFAGTSTQPWPVAFFRAGNRLFVFTPVGEFSAGLWANWVRWVLVLFLSLCELLGIVYLSRVIDEVRFPNLRESVRAKPGLLRRIFGGYGIEYPLDEEDEDTDPDPVADDKAPWKGGV